MKVHTFTRLCFPGHQFWNRDIDRSVKEELITSLALRTNCTYDQVFATTLRSYEGVLFEKHNEKTTSNWILPLGLFHRTWKNNGLMFCPHCFQKDGVSPYFRKLWRSSLSVVCLECKRYLLDHCPECKVPISFFRNELGKKENEPEGKLILCFNCKLDFSTINAIHADEDIVLIQKQIVDIIELGWKNTIYPFQFFDVLRVLLKILVGRRNTSVLVQKEIAELLNIEIKAFAGGYANRFDTLSIEDRAYSLKMAFWLLDNWPDRFIEFFRSVEVYSSDLLRDVPNLPYWYWSVVYSNFYKSNVNRRFG